MTQAVKNVQRLRAILGVFGRHGLQEFLIRMGLERHLSASAKEEGVENRTLPERLRMAFEHLGPTFVKLGQLLSNRPDMIPENFIDEFKKLQDNVAPLPFEAIRTQIEKELGGKISDFFSEIHAEPLASASIGQVHAAKLLDGSDVVVKVQRPDIDHTIKQDISILSFLAAMMEKYLPETKFLSPQQIVEEFSRALHYELDFVIEANTMIRFAENARGNSKVVIPKVFRKLSGKRVLTMERLHGARITDLAAVKAMGINPRDLVDIGARAFFKNVMIDGLFHGDLHGGNVFAMKNPETGEAQIGVIDFGIVGRLSQKSRDSFSRMVLALVSEDYETLCYEYAELGASGTGIDFDAFQREVRNTLSPYVGAALKDVNAGAILIEATKIAVRYSIKIPGDWMVVFKAIFTLEGMGRQLDPDFDLLAIGSDLVKTVLKDRYSFQRITKDFAWLARDVNALLQVAPRQIRWMFRKFNANDFAFEIKFKEVEVIRRQMERSFRGLGLAILTAALFMAAAMSLQMQSGHFVFTYYPLPSILFFSMGLIGFLGLILRSWR